MTTSDKKNAQYYWKISDILLNSNNNKTLPKTYNILPKIGFERQTSGVGSDHSTNWATTTPNKFVSLDFYKSHRGNKMLNLIIVSPETKVLKKNYASYLKPHSHRAYYAAKYTVDLAIWAKKSVKDHFMQRNLRSVNAS